MPSAPVPEPIPMQPRPDDTAADTGTLVEMGVVEEQPTPAEPDPAPEPADEPPADTPPE
ncbi:hypothetical protein RB625_19895 [Streptomyces californicus]|uniref:hypothetical protein n=1 Tax=Streptomyces californicus TaxID=67351 RepID=UPI00296FBC38|nr:hypothetical protein [Streptomyces californicus]MDW4900676.1 hypothetical protein [Streptomyces californicus]